MRKYLHISKKNSTFAAIFDFITNFSLQIIDNMKERTNDINEQIKTVIDKIKKEQKVGLVELAEKIGISKTSLSLSLSKRNPNNISTTKLLELSTALGKHLVIGFLSDEQIEEFERRVKSVDECATPTQQPLSFCPNCGEDLKKYNSAKFNRKKNIDESIISNFVICEDYKVDLEAKKAQRDKLNETYKKLGKTIAGK